MSGSPLAGASPNEKPARGIPTKPQRFSLIALKWGVVVGCRTNLLPIRAPQPSPGGARLHGGPGGSSPGLAGRGSRDGREN